MARVCPTLYRWTMKRLSAIPVSTITGAAMLACLPLPALAAPLREAPKEWEVTLGAGASLRPTFEGSDRSLVRPLPVISVKWRDTISLGEGGLSAAWHRKGFRIGAGLTFDPGRKDHSSGGIFESGDDRLKGLGTINASLGLQSMSWISLPRTIVIFA